MLFTAWLFISKVKAASLFLLVASWQFELFSPWARHSDFTQGLTMSMIWFWEWRLICPNLSLLHVQLYRLVRAPARLLTSKWTPYCNLGNDLHRLLLCPHCPLSFPLNNRMTRLICSSLVESSLSMDNNVLYAVLHEPIYCERAASDWAAERVGRTLREVSDRWREAVCSRDGWPGDSQSLNGWAAHHNQLPRFGNPPCISLERWSFPSCLTSSRSWKSWHLLPTSLLNTQIGRHYTMNGN